MIIRAVRSSAGGTTELNALAMAEMRRWVGGVVAEMAATALRATAISESDARRPMGSLGQLASVLQQMGDLSEARHLYEVAMERQTQQLGPTHVDTLTTQVKLAYLLKEMGQRAESRRLYESAAEGQTQELGPVHSDTLDTKAKLALLLLDMGEREEAQRLSATVADGFTTHLGAAHASTAVLRSMSNLAALLDRTEARVVPDVKVILTPPCIFH